MKVCVLASGSKGNATYIASPTTSLLIDLGPSCAYVEKQLQEIDVDPNQIEGILITHTHVDHIGGLRVFIKKYNPIIYLTKKMYEELSTMLLISNYQLIESDFMLHDIAIKIIKTSHDVADSNGYILEHNGKSVVYITDTGYINYKNHKRLQNKSLYIMESNHDVEMLMNGKYPYHVKQRILGDRGHLSNQDSAYYLSHFIGNETKYIVLAHLSEDNNTRELALSTLEEALRKENQIIEHIVVATQKDRTELLEV